MEQLKVGLLCVALSLCASQAMAFGDHRHHHHHHDEGGSNQFGGQGEEGQNGWDTNGPTASVPEPASIGLLAIGALGVVAARRFKK